MTIQERFVCDRDGQTAVTSTGELPDGWLDLTTLAMDEDGGARRGRHLCPACKQALRGFMNGEAVPAIP